MRSGKIVPINDSGHVLYMCVYVACTEMTSFRNTVLKKLLRVTSTNKVNQSVKIQCTGNVIKRFEIATYN